MQESAEKPQLDKLDEKFAAKVADLPEQLVNKLLTLLQGKTTYGYHRLLRRGALSCGTKFSQKLLDELPARPTRRRALQWGT